MMMTRRADVDDVVIIIGSNDTHQSNALCMNI